METSQDGENLLDIYDQYAESFEGQAFKRNTSLGKLDRVTGQSHSIKLQQGYIGVLSIAHMLCPHISPQKAEGHLLQV